MEIRYSSRLIKPRKVIVDQNGKIVNKNPSKEIDKLLNEAK